ncbi:PREDICTED: putative E3 ubiquitin-protein ligase RING1a isoform X3 [Nelumbo nucifera]|uniref:E3 ubiquitin-protein ligase RING1a isoform X3 n=1 Tax=Nelumbo nucifera TaxID=4432 RepID=A0A1U8AEM9_NELNU|nr:PREDICTED: putative E3 ubiquitin-protein ligase RING1a isoform X3 [Nelumbo nucifera]
MPAQKRSSENLEEESQQRHHYQQQNHHQNQSHREEGVDEDDDGEEDFDGSPSSSGGDKDEFVLVRLSDVRKEVQCPICLGIIRKTRTVMECLHRFCRECIDKSMRLGNNECPACRTHCASRRSLRDDPNYDALIAALYPDIDKYEEEELAFHEEEKNRNKQVFLGQIQASIAQTLRRQSEALGRRRTTAKATAAAFVRKSQGNYRNLRGRRSSRGSEIQGSDDDDEANGDGGKDSSSADERSTELDVHLMLVPLDEQSMPSLQRPYLCCKPTLSVKHLCQFVALQTPVQAEEVEILVVKEPHHMTADQCGSGLEPSTSKDDHCKNGVQILEEQETLAGIQASCTSSRGNLVLTYRQKVSS